MTETNDSSPRAEVFRVLLEKVEQDRYPSSQQLDLLERHLSGRERDQLIRLLSEKVAADRYPSMQMIKRLLRIAS